MLFGTGSAEILCKNISRLLILPEDSCEDSWKKSANGLTITKDQVIGRTVGVTAGTVYC